VKPGGRLAGYVIHTPGGLGAADEQRARELGPDHVTGAALPEALTREAGFSQVTREDVTPQFRTTVEALLRAARQWESELRAEQGDAEYADGCQRGRAKLIGIREGLLLRSLVTAIKR
jgi:hypothetical protein